MKNSKFLFDTNILVFAQDPMSKNQQEAERLHLLVLDEKIEGFIATQNLLEFYAVITSSPKISVKTPSQEAIRVFQHYQQNTNFRLITPTELTLDIFYGLSSGLYKLKGKQVFDIYLAATALTYGVSQILTDNEKDFDGIPSIKAINPFKEKNDL